ncbi:SDR family oxidoreductase [Streptomyces sp. NBC_00083]|uniref:SDR family oxidoreductase n=1 Tax=Streptomyces sp. NBC_00083 TaxID=2975647 RepID=UPI00224EC255|nr:NAD(P)H-binding protein [Streptomyces sp. NBC_00083]MCX5387705.1 NAD(P)H-binding protein [Streptomyces sp. NBC_00083]
MDEAAMNEAPIGDAAMDEAAMKGAEEMGVLDIAVAGGTGTLGRHVVEQLRARGHRVRVLSRGSAQFPVDLSTGEGLAAALAGCDVVVDAANSTAPRTVRATLVDGTRRLLEAERAAGVGHHVCVSIVGCDRVPMPYYKVKTDQEGLVAAGRVPWTIVRATQFHELAAGVFTATARARFLPASASVPLQPIAAAEAARAVADAAGSAPRNGRVEVAGPDRTDLRALATAWRATTGRGAVLLPVPIPGRIGRALRAGHLTESSPDARGTIGFAQWLEEQPRP